MPQFSPTIIIRHARERIKKCSLRGLEKRPDFLFFRYPLKHPLPCENYILLSLDATTPLSSNDRDSGLILLDGTWRLAQKMEETIPFPSGLQKRRLPQNFQTAYPRRQDDCSDPDQGLASIEALFCAYLLLGRPIDTLLDHYYWKDAFLEKNALLC